MSAIKRAMGIRGHKVWLSQVQRWLKSNRGFVVADIYRRPSTKRRHGVAKVSHPKTLVGPVDRS